MLNEHATLSRRGFLGSTVTTLIGSSMALGATPQEQTRRIVSSVTIPPQSARGVFVERDQWIKVITPRGVQVSDLFAFVRDVPDEYLCPRTTMTRQRRLYPQLGQPFYSIKRRPLLMLEEDTVGVHDLFYPACDRYMFRDENHPSCRGNLNAVLEEMNFTPGGHAEPHNLFQYSPAIDMDGNLQVRQSPARPGDYVLLKALDDLLVIATSCSVDTGVINGGECKEILLEVHV
jgi:hypothetical protein